MIDCLQAVFTFLWTIWTSKNLVTHRDKNPNPLEVILTAQKLFCRYKKAFNMEGNQGRRSTSTNTVSQSMGEHWDLIIKISGAKARRSGRLGVAYEAITPQGLTIFKGVQVVQQQQQLKQHKKLQWWLR